MKINKYTKIGNFLNSRLVKNRNKITIFDGETIPSHSIADYIERIIEGISDENDYNWCIPVALIYIKRLRDNGLKLTEYNIHRIVLTSILIAIKYWEDDYSFDESEYIFLSGVRNNIELDNLQITFLNLVNWKLYIKREDYENMELFYMTLFT